MDYPNRLEWQTRCEFNAYCKRALRNELIDACRERKRRQLREVIFSDLLRRRLEDYCKTACRSSAHPAGRKKTSRIAVLLFQHDRR